MRKCLTIRYQYSDREKQTWMNKSKCFTSYERSTFDFPATRHIPLGLSHFIRCPSIVIFERVILRLRSFNVSVCVCVLVAFKCSRSDELRGCGPISITCFTGQICAFTDKFHLNSVDLLGFSITFIKYHAFSRFFRLLCLLTMPQQKGINNTDCIFTTNIKNKQINFFVIIIIYESGHFSILILWISFFDCLQSEYSPARVCVWVWVWSCATVCNARNKRHCHFLHWTNTHAFDVKVKLGQSTTHRLMGRNRHNTGAIFMCSRQIKW